MTKKYSLVSILVLAVILSACDMTYRPSQQVLVTPSPTEREFTKPLPGDDQMAIVESFATGTAGAMTTEAGDGGLTSTLTPIGGTPGTPGNQVTFTPTPIVVGGQTLTASVTPILVGGGTLTPSPTLITSRPATWTLQKGEFVYCIARRFNVDPDDILALNGIVDSETVYPGTVLKIPQSGAFPGERAWHVHPATFTVGVTASYDEYNTIYGVACYYGDVDPARIAQANNLSLSAQLTVGQVLNIP